MVNSQVVDLTTLCNTFPEMANNKDTIYIPRNNILDTIDKAFESGTQVVRLEGEEGLGKTTILAQFAKRHNNNTISLFVKRTNRWGYDPQYLLYDICNQLNWFFHKTWLENPNVANDAFLRTYLIRLQQHLRIYKSKFYFVVDGLDELNKEFLSIQEMIIDMLPIGMSNFKFLISGNLNNFPGKTYKGVISKSFPLVALTYGETEKFFSDINLKKDHLSEIYNTCKGIPGHLASVKRILKTGIDIDSFIEEMPYELPDLFAYEWSGIDENNNLLMKSLAVLAYDHNIHTTTSLSLFLGVDESDIRNALKNVNFLCIDPLNNCVSYVSDVFKKFASNKLSFIKDEVTSLIIDYFLSDPESELALTNLPGYYEQAGQYDNVIQYLSPQRFEEMLKKIQSYSIIDRMSSIALNAAEILTRDNDMLRFSMQKSIFNQLNGAEVWRSEIEARMALKDYESAIALAQTNVLKEERLHLLAVIARKKREQGLLPEPELIDQIRNLYKQIDIDSLGERAVEIAVDLIFSVPELATEIIEKSSSLDNGDNSLDWAFAKVSVSAIVSDNEFLRSDTYENISSRIKNPILKHFSAGANLLLGKYSAKEVIAEVEKIEGTSDRLFFLCHWTVVNNSRDDAIDVINYALNLTLKTTAYAPNAKIYRQLAVALPNISDKERVKYFIGIFDSQRTAIEHLGPTEDYVRLQLILAEAEIQYDFDAARNRLNEIYLYISYISDFDSRISCMSRFSAILEKIDPTKLLENIDALHSITESDLETNIKLLLNSTGGHYDLTRGVIRALSKFKPTIAIDIISKFNIEKRRDLGTIEFIKGYINQPLDKLDFLLVENVIESIKDKDLKDMALIKLIEQLSKTESIDEYTLNKLMPLLNKIEEISDAAERCKACYVTYSVLKNSTIKVDGLDESLLIQLEKAWDSIDISWRKINIGFKIVESMAEHSMDIAKVYLKQTEDFRDITTLESSTNAFTYITCLKLTIRDIEKMFKETLIDNTK
jgi:hypothetical protein